MKLSYHSLIAISALFLCLVCNVYFFTLISPSLSFFKLFLVGLLLFSLLGLALEILCLSWSAKFVLGLILLLSAFSSYSINSLGVGITPDLIHSVLSANPREIKETFNPSLLSWLLFVFLLPCVGFAFVRFTPSRLLSKLFFISFYSFLSLILWFGLIGKEVIFLFKQNRTLYYVLNPISPIRSTIQYLSDLDRKTLVYTHIAMDAKLLKSQKPKLIIFIIGESARSANFSLNGYAKNTNAYTSKQDNFVSFKDFSSCGVITAISVPCMMTDYTHKTYTKRYLSDFRDNLLDITQRLGIKTYYLGNNGGGCIGNICIRLPKEQVKFYNDESLDEVMFDDLDSLLAQSKQNTFIILHQMGSHGQNYFQRYPQSFATFKPTCDTADIQTCSLESLENTYDNSLLYTDFFINAVIERLKMIQDRFDVALWYVSDHGESLGENGMYMHGGLPYFLSPQTQTKVPSILWLGQGFEAYLPILRQKIEAPLSQDYVFHTLLHLWGIETQEYNPLLDLLQNH